MTPKNYKFTKEHEWICPDGNKGTVGITDYAQHELGDIVYVDLPSPGAKVAQFKRMCEIESVKAVAEFFAPASGTITEVNQAAIDEPKIINEDPYGKAWLVKIEISDPAELNNLMNSDQYDVYTAKLTKEMKE